MPRILVLSGGGANGAYEAGAVKFLIGSKNIKYDAVVGASVGGLNAAAIHFSNDPAKGLENLWLSIKGNSDIYKKWYGGLLGHIPFLWKDSLYNPKPLEKLIEKSLKDESSGIRAHVALTNFNTGMVHYERMLDSNKRMLDSNIKHNSKALLATSAIPLIFPSVEMKLSTYVDGGIKENTPLNFACEGLKATHVDIVCCFANKPMKLIINPSKIETLKRVVNMMRDEIQENDLVKFNYINKLCDINSAPVGKRKISMNLIRPYDHLGDILDFSPEKTRRLIFQGFEDAEAQYSSNWIM